MWPRALASPKVMNVWHFADVAHLTRKAAKSAQLLGEMMASVYIIPFHFLHSSSIRMQICLKKE